MQIEMGRRRRHRHGGGHQRNRAGGCGSAGLAALLRGLARALGEGRADAPPAAGRHRRHAAAGAERRSSASESGSEAGAVIAVCAGSDCRCRWNDRSLVDDLKREVAASGRTDIEVRPCGCIDRCAEGPIVVVRQSGDVSGVPVRDTTHVRVQAGDVRDIVAAIGRGATNQD